ncbi:hypothetical protein [Nocardioides baculatus]|uniref:Uncharacterized protein n=1 Tax=Nocardioides baculatus TaxID=2801337 RepID=A0ABS1LFH6_9ACTN|nr:hypothetical protein [Nocardioides baculatus]MBL0749932.1 hypothetical protein [Nocardioides baculatus]
MTRSAQRVVGIVVLVVLGLLTLPVVAYFADTGDGDGTENWIIPVALLAMAVIGAALAIALPGLAREGASTGRRALTGVWWGLLGLFVGLVVFWFLLNGLDAGGA